MREQNRNSAQTAEDLFAAGTVAYEAKDYDAALRAYEQAAGQGHVGAQLKCGEMYYKGQGTWMNLLTALSWYEKAAEQGHVGAQYTCAEMCLEWDWDPSHDWTGRRLMWLEKADAQTIDEDVQERAKAILKDAS